MHRATAELEASGIEGRALKICDRAPDFALFNQDHVEVSSKDLLDLVPWLKVSFGDTGALLQYGAGGSKRN